MTIFGWIYLIFSLVYAVALINSIDKPRTPLTRETVIASLIGSGLSFWALYVWGIHS